MSENASADAEKKPQKRHNQRNHQRRHQNENEHGSSQGRRHNARNQQHSHKVDMRKYEKMISDIQNNFSDIKQSNGAKDDCTICCKPCDIFGVGECRHPICIECSVRIRVLNGQKACPVCRRENETLVLLFASNGLETVSLEVSQHGHPAEERFGIRFENKEVGERYEQYLAHVCKICKTPEGERLEFNTFTALRQHMAQAHQLTYCNICTDNLNLFSRERKTYDREKLQRHIRIGDYDDKSQKGHPTCLFCDERFFDNEGQYRHLRKEHFYCQFCEADGTMTNSFFGKHEDLLQHYKAKHFLCEHENCRSAGIAFATQVEFNLHKTQHSGKSMHLDFQYNDRRQVTGHGRMRREQGAPRLGSQQLERIAVVPAEPTPQAPPQPNTEIIVVPSAQSSGRPLRYGRSSYQSRMEDFPSLGGGAPSSAPQVVVPHEFPRLNRVGKATPAAAAPKAPKKPAEDFPSLGGRAPSSSQQQSNPNWGQHTGNFEVIDDDERAASVSSPQLPARVLQPPGGKLPVRRQPPAQQVQAKREQQPQTEDFPALPVYSNKALASQSNWANKTKGKSAITGLVMPKKKPLPVPDIWPDRPVTTPASDYQPVEETWADVPYAKKLTVKQRRELQKKQMEAEQMEQTEMMQTIQKKMMIAPDEDLEMQAILMNDIASSSGVSSAELSGRGGAVLKEKNEAEGMTKTQMKKQKKMQKQNAAAPANGGTKVQETQPEFPSLQSTIKKSSPRPATPEQEPEAQGTGGISSWLYSSLSSALNGLSLSNVLGDHSQPLSSMPTEPVPAEKKSPAAPTPPLQPSSHAPPPGLVAPPPGISFAPPPGFEHFTPPPGLASPTNMFASAPILSHKDLVRPQPPPQQPVNDGWSTTSGRTKAK